MTDLAEIENLAREYVRLDDTILAPSDDDMALARFVLRALLVLQWAERWRGESCSRLRGCDPYDGTHDFDCDLELNSRIGCDAIDAFRKAGG